MCQKDTCEERFTNRSLSRTQMMRFSLFLAAQEIALWSSTNGAIPYFLVWSGSELSITEIAE